MAFPPACPRCGCTDRGPFHNKITRQISGRTAGGFQFTAVTWDRTHCLECGQKYTVRTPIRPASGTRTSDPPADG